MSQYTDHVEQYHDCQLCALHKVRKQVVLCRGELPCEVLFIGEAPGPSEDSTGKPFKGPAGRRMDAWIADAEERANIRVKKAWTNVVCCIPRDLNSKRKKEEPLPEEMEACWPRLDAFIDIAKPTFIVCVGALAAKQAKLHHWEERCRKVIEVIHPASILRNEKEQPAKVGLDQQRAVLALTDLFSDLIPF